MTDWEKILKSLALAGVEWELGAIDNSQLTINSQNSVADSNADTQPPAANSFIAPKASAPMSNANILEIAKRRASEPDVIAAIKSFSEHPLFSGAKNTVVPNMPVGDCKLLVVTDIPSLTDDQTGAILSGPEGDLFDKMMSAIGLSRTGIAIMPLIFWRPAGGRTPTAEELAFCRPFVDRIIADLHPEKILTLGATAAREIANATLPRDHGKIFGNTIPIYKPDFILQNPNVKTQVWSALQTIMN